MSVASGAKAKIPLARYILNRLHQHGCSALHGVPGDYTLPFLSHISHSKVKWIGNCNELNAGYAADSYARITGLGAVCTTFGVGELSAINAIAGSYAERVPVVHIVGTPSTTTQNKWVDSQLGLTKFDSLVHHALGRNKSLKTFGQMAKRVTGRIVLLSNALDKAAAFDRVLHCCLTMKMPVYVDLPSDLGALPVETSENANLLVTNDEYTAQVSLGERETLMHQILAKVGAAKKPIIMVDGLASRFGLNNAINKLVAASQVPTVVTPHGLGIVSSKHPSYYGVYSGNLGNSDLHDYIQSSDCVLIFGELFSDTNTVGWTATPPTSDPNVTTLFTENMVTFRGKRSLTNVSDLLENLTETLVNRKPAPQAGVQTQTRSYFDVPPRNVLPQSLHTLEDPSASDSLTQDYLYPRLSTWLKNHDTLLLANGTPLIGASLLSLPPQTRVVASGLWFSVGQMLPAAQGAALAQQSLPKAERGRTILLEGDGSFQATCQELSTIIRYKLDVTIFLVNNKGYAYERLIQGPTASYNDVNDWDYTLAPALMGGHRYLDGSTSEDDAYKIFTRKISTTHELDEILANTEFNSPHGLKLIELQMGGLDVPAHFRPALEAVGKRLAQVADPPEKSIHTTKPSRRAEQADRPRVADRDTESSDHDDRDEDSDITKHIELVLTDKTEKAERRAVVDIISQQQQQQNKKKKKQKPPRSRQHRHLTNAEKLE